MDENHSPDQSLSQSPAPSKEMEERISELSFNARLLRDENTSLKRELAICAKDRDNFRSASENASRNYVTLSASYQRQKDALQRLYNYQAQRSSPDTAWDEPMMRNARTALAETPEVKS